MSNILIIDDELPIRESFALILEGEHNLFFAASGEGALKVLTDNQIDLAFLDIRMPGLNGLETLKRLKEIDPAVEVVMVTAVNEVEKASEAIKLGARDYLIKPFNVEDIKKMTDSILRRKSLLRAGNAISNNALKATTELIGHSEKINTVKKLIERIAPTELKILIIGEAGTEREETARIIREKSPRSGQPFLTVALNGKNPASQTALFLGKESGSTTIDLKKSSGLLERAEQGTIFIDHIEHLAISPAALVENNVRLIVGTTRPGLVGIAPEVFKSFAEAVVELPPLRERVADLPILIEHHLQLFSRRYGKEKLVLATETEEALTAYRWPGNTAELAAVIERLVLTATEKEIKLEALPLEFTSKVADLGIELSGDFEKAYMKAVRRDFGDDPSRLSTLLRIPQSLLESQA